MSTQTTTFCDVCRRDLKKVNTHRLSGEGQLEGEYSLSGFGGGASKQFTYQDICAECCEVIFPKIQDIISSQAQMIKLKNENKDVLNRGKRASHERESI